MRTAEYFAKSSEDSADVMQIWTEQMHEKTMSMHVITVFTLIFLPGTFVATIFSSGILTFGADGSAGFGSDMGDWKQPLCDRGFETRSVELRRDTAAAFLPPWGGGFYDPVMDTRKEVRQIGGEVGRLKEKYTGRDGIEGERPNYIPLSELERFWTPSRLSTIMGAYPNPPVQDPATITKRFLRVFSLLIYTGNVSFLEDFVEAKLEDNKFPIDKAPSSWPDTRPYHKLFNQVNESQWMFFPLTIEPNGLYNQTLSARQILPIDEKEEIKTGVSVSVCKIRTRKECTRFNETTFVLKTYGKSSYNQFDRERKVFNSLQSHRPPHIVACYGSFMQEQLDGTLTYNLLLEWVNGGNLEEFFNNIQPPQTSKEVNQFWGAFIGSFEGLHHLHLHAKDQRTPRYQGIHQDIKPENILVSKGPSGEVFDISLKIADFGFCHTKVVENDDDNAWGVDSHGGQTYGTVPTNLQTRPDILIASSGAPECSHHATYTQRGPHRITTEADIFSMGCVMSDAAAWVVGGQSGRDEYRKKRANETKEIPSFNRSGHDGCFHDGVYALNAVAEMHDAINDSVSDFDFITPGVLKLAQDHMLLRQGDGRWVASELREKLTTIKQAAVEETSPTQERQNTPPQMPSPPSENTTATDNRLRLEISPSNPPSTTSRTSLQSLSSLMSPISSPLSAKTLGKSPENSPIVSPTEKSNNTTAGSSFPELTLEQVRAYRHAKKNKLPVNSEVERVISILSTNFKHRDHMFFIDTSGTMGQHAEESRNAFKDFAYVAKLIDDDGIELCFSSNPQKMHRSSHTSNLVTKFSHQQWNQIGFEDKFGVFIDKHVIPRLSSKVPKFIRSPTLKRLSIFVFTDGRWGYDENAAGGVENPIKKLMDEIKHQKLDRTQVMLQFIRFGNDNDGKRFLSYLDDFGKEFDL
ncbi:hypothetical protein G7Z17_g10225 [Cylindrodendrum hubeiense]|uniref:non-specific serine/threonine protein kinase n=1 Tax=Cylindrodendrum hubeiense TaxID=595255 RepID=A0A9P5H2I5_9HYPO|nr:hypothetical protein G7Z17_g10225 [Cylindrodendrum hubeiense]